jgi:hypothetical protein
VSAIVVVGGVCAVTVPESTVSSNKKSPLIGGYRTAFFLSSSPQLETENW